MAHLSTLSYPQRCIIILATLFLISPLAVANEPSRLFSSNVNFFPILPRATIEGTAATESLRGGGDGMIPIFGSYSRGILFADLGGQYDNHDAFDISTGAGLRTVLNNQIIGAYFFSDYTKTRRNGTYEVLNPGLEWMTRNWDAEVNGYFPTAHRKLIKNLGFGSMNCEDAFVSFSGHTEFDQQLQQYGVVGNGVDGEVGYSFPWRNLRSRIYAGGYHYAASSHLSSISGAQVGIEYPINRFATLVLAGSDDNVFKVKGAATLRLTFGGGNNQIACNVRDRLVDPTHRHLGTLNTAAAIPSQKLIKNSGISVPILTNIWFFKPGVSTLTEVTGNEGTFENPIVGINQNVINSIGDQAPNAMFYFAPGQYYPIATPVPTPGALTLISGQSWWGREFGYACPAQGPDRATINGVLQLPGNNILDSLQIVNNSVKVTSVFGDNIVGVNILDTSTGPLTLNNLNIVTADNSNGAFDIFAAGNSSINLTNSTLQANQTNIGSANGAENIAIVGNNVFGIDNSTLTANNTGDGGAFGIFTDYGISKVTINNSTFNTNNIGNNGAFGFSIGGSNGGVSQVAINHSTFNTIDDGLNTASSIVLTTDGSSVTLNDTTLNAQEINVNSVGGAMGVFLVSNSDVTIINSHVIATNSGSGSGGAFAVKIESGFAGATATINGSTLNTTDNGNGGSAGLVMRDGNATLNNTTINALQNGTTNGGAFGVELLGGGTVTISNSHLNATDNGTNGSTGLFVQNGTATLTNTNINAVENSTGQASGIFATSNGSVNITGGDIAATGNGSGLVTGVQANNNSAINVNAATFHVNANSGEAIGAVANAGSNVSIFGSTFSRIFSQTGKASGVQNNGSTITVTNNNFTIVGNAASEFSSGTIFVSPAGNNCTVNGNPC